MNTDKEQIQVEFHNKATVLFFSVCRAFEEAVSNVSRRNEEYRFQQLKIQYAVTLEKELQVIAKDVLVKYRKEKQMKEIGPLLHQFIKDYLHRFVQKINDL